MKIKIKYIVSVIIFAVAIFGLIAINGRVNADESEVEMKNNVSYTSQRSAHDIKDDGWVYVFEIDYPDDKEDKNMYMFDGYNLKYKELEGFYIPVRNSETGEEIDRVKPNYITLSISEIYKKDIKKIGDFFNKLQFNDMITIADLKDLDIENFSKEYLVDMFNRALTSELKTIPGEYYESSFVDKTSVTSTDKNMTGEWQISYLLDFGYISDVNIEFIDSKGNYLSDVVKSSNASMTEKTIFDDVQKIEKNIIETQRIESNLVIEQNSNYSDLDKLMDNLSKKFEENK